MDVLYGRLLLMTFAALLHRKSSAEYYTVFGKPGDSFNFTCDLEVQIPIGTLKLYYFSKLEFQEVLSRIYQQYFVANSEFSPLSNISKAYKLLQRGENLTDASLTFYKTGDITYTMRWSLSFTYFTCEAAGIYHCHTMNPQPGWRDQIHTKIIIGDYVLINKVKYTQRRNVRGAYMQGSTVVVKCVAETTPHDYKWKWEKFCSGFDSYKSVKNSWDMEIESASGRKYHECYLDYNNSSLTFDMTPDLHGCFFRCVMYAEIGDNKKVFVNRTVQIFIDWNAKSAGFTLPCVEDFGEDFFLLPIAAALTFLLYAIAIYLAYQKDVFRNMKIPSGKPSQKRSSISPKESSPKP